uniref:Uncharacterized protein n=1 Tax=Arion vulgaris TaxID=1028688 RepID=A0A0B7BD66_9EUPU
MKYSIGKSNILVSYKRHITLIKAMLEESIEDDGQEEDSYTNGRVYQEIGRQSSVSVVRKREEKSVHRILKLCKG